MAAIARLQAVLGLDEREFKAGMERAGKHTSSFQSQIKQVGSLIAGAFSVGAIVSMGKSLATWASDISEAAQNAGILTSEMMALNEVALKGGLGVDEMRRMLAAMQIKLSEAIDGSKEARKAFEGIGLSVTELAGMDPAAMFQKIAQAATASNAPLESIAEIFGSKLGPKAMSAIRDLAENGLPALNESAARMADEIEDAGDRWGAAVDKMKRKTVGLVLSVIEGAKVAGAFISGASKGMSTTEKIIRAGLAIPTFGASVMPTKDQFNAGMEAAVEEQNKQFAEEQARANARKAQRDAEREARVKKSSLTDIRLAGESFDQQRKQMEDPRDLLAEQNKRSNAALDREAADRFARVKASQDAKEEWFRGNSRLAEQLQSSGGLNGSQITPDALARIGGFFGNDRSGYDVQAKQLEVQKDTQRLVERIADGIAELVDSESRRNGGV